jgi:hypothetical protein
MNGAILRDVMDRQSIERARAKSSAPGSLMWDKFYGEAAKKTVAKRLAKQAPFSRDLQRLINRDEEDPVIDGEVVDGETAAIERKPVPEPLRPPDRRVPRKAEPAPQPEPESQPEPKPEPPTAPIFAVVDLDGVEHLHPHPMPATAQLHSLLAESEKLGGDRLDGCWESNSSLVEQLHATGNAQQADSLAMAYADARQRINDAAAAKAANEAAKMNTPPPPAEPAAKAEDVTSTAGSDIPSPTGEGAAVGDAGPARQSLNIPMVLRSGKADYRTWTMALFLPKLRRQRDEPGLAYLLGDNEENLLQVRAQGALSKDDRAELDRSIEHQWGLVRPGQPQP